MKFTIKEEMGFASQRAKEHAAELHHFEANQPHYPFGFSVGYRNPGHWAESARSSNAPSAAGRKKAQRTGWTGFKAVRQL